MPQQMTEEQRKELEEKIKNMSPEELKEFQKQQCIFCQIIDSKIPSKKVYEDKICIAVLDINPATEGHILILPKEHYSIMPQIPEKEVEHMFLVAKYLSQLILKILKVSGTNVFVANGLVAGQKAQHFMIHLIPRKEGDGVLEIEEKLLPPEMVEKVKSVVEDKLNTLLGVKKRVVRVDKGEQTTLASVKGVKEEVKEEVKEPIEDEIQKKKSTKKMKTKKREIIEKEDVSLDDIASLFK